MKTAKIYGLINPLTKEIFYIGLTNNGLRERLFKHISQSGRASKLNAKEKYIVGMLLRGLKPEIILLKRVSRHRGPHTENKYIAKYREINPNLTNDKSGSALFTQEIVTKLRDSKTQNRFTPENNPNLHSALNSIQGFNYKGKLCL